MIDNIRKNYIYNLCYQVLIVIIPLVMTPYISRVLGSTNLGIYDYCLSISTLIVTFSLLGIGNYANRQIAYTRNNKESLSKTFYEILCGKLFLGIIALIIFTMVCYFNRIYFKYLIIFLVWIIANILDCTWLYLGVEDMQYTVAKNIIAKLIFVVGTFIFIRDKSDLSLYIFLFGISVLIANLLAYTQVPKYVNKCSISFKNMYIHIWNSFKLFIPTVTTQIFLSIDKLILGSMSDNISNVSIYSNADKIIQIPLSLITVMNVVMMPRLANEFSKNNKDKINEHLINSAEISMFMAFPICLGLFVVSDNLIPWFLGDEFFESINTLKLLTPVVIGNTLIGISANQYFIATNQNKILIISSVCSTCINLILDIALVPIYGVKGICIATVLSIIITVVIQYHYMNKQLKIKSIYLAMYRYFIYSVFMSLCIFFITSKMKPSPLCTLLQVVLGGIIYISICIIKKDKVIMELISMVKVIIYKNKG